MLFRDLTHKDGKPVTVNLDLVRYMSPTFDTPPATAIWFDSGVSVTVKETIKQILTISPGARK